MLLIADITTWLNGNVTKIGGLESKIDGAKTAGIKHVLCPKENEHDLLKIRERKHPPEDNDFKVTLIDSVFDAIKYMLNVPDNKKPYFQNLQKS